MKAPACVFELHPRTLREEAENRPPSPSRLQLCGTCPVQPGPARLCPPEGRSGSGSGSGPGCGCCPGQGARPPAAAAAVPRRLSRRASSGATAGLAVRSPTCSCGGRKPSNTGTNISLEPFLFNLPTAMRPPPFYPHALHAGVRAAPPQVCTRAYIATEETFPRFSRDSEELIRTDTTGAVVTVKFSNSTPSPALARAGAGCWELLLHFPRRQLIPLNSLGFTPRHLLTARIKPPL